MALLIVDNGENDLCKLAKILDIDHDRHPWNSWLKTAEQGGYSGIALCASDYPNPTQLTDQESKFIDNYRKSGGRVFAEFAAFPATELPVIREALYERLVCTCETGLTCDLEPLTILEEHQSLCIDLPETGQPVLHYARVAGVYTAVFDLPEQTWPGMVLDESLLLSALCVSQYHHFQFKLERNWKKLLSRVLLWAAGDAASQTGLPDEITNIDRPDIDDQPRTEAYEQCIRNNIRWYLNNRMLPRSDGKMGICEGYWGIPNEQGEHFRKESLRPDCITESAYAFYLASKLELTDQDLASASCNAMDFVVAHTQFQSKGIPVYGLFSQHINRKLMIEKDPRLNEINSHDWNRDWMNEIELERDSAEKCPSYVPPDDNGWIVLMLLEMYREVGNVEWLDSAMLAAESMRYNKFGCPGIMGDFFNPHTFSMPQAAYLYVYAMTGREEYLAVAEQSILWLACEEANWHETNTITTEHVRFLLPLSLASYYTGKPIYQKMIDRSLSHVIAHQDQCGAILETGQERSVQTCQSNAEYGTSEGSIIQTGNERITDQLYCNSFALMNLYLVWKITGRADAEKAFYHLANFLSEIQIDRSAGSSLDGTWMRGFDVDNWEYYGSNHDFLWGPYCVETGWTNAIIDMTLAWHLLDYVPLPKKGTTDHRAIESLDKSVSFFNTFIPNQSMNIAVHM